MLDQLRRLVGSDSTNANRGSSEGIPPSGNGRNHHHHSHSRPSLQQQQQRSGSLNRLSAYAVHPSAVQYNAAHLRTAGRAPLRMQLSYMAPPPIVAYSRNGRPVVYEQWVRYSHHHSQQYHVPVTRQSSAIPDLQAGNRHKKSQPDLSEAMFTSSKHLPPQRQRLAPSRSLDSIHPHRVVAKPQTDEGTVGGKGSSARMKEFFGKGLQRIRQSVGGSGFGIHKSAGGSGREVSSADWLLHRPSPVKNAPSKPTTPTTPTQRPTTPGMAVIRRIFARSPSLNPTPAETITPTSPSKGSSPEKHPLSGTKSLLQQLRPSSPSANSSSDSCSKLDGKCSSTISTADVDRRGDPDGATFPRSDVADQSAPDIGGGKEEVQETATTAVDSPPVSSTPTVLGNLKQRSKLGVKKPDPPAFRVRRRGSQLRRSERKRRSLRRSGRKKKKSRLLSAAVSKTSLVGNSHSALSGAKLVSDWTYLPLPTTYEPPVPTPPSEPAEEKDLTEEIASSQNGRDNDLYQVLVDRPRTRRHIPPPMWDPLIFVPPERRRTTSFRTPSGPAADVVSSGGIEAVLSHQPWIRSSKLRAQDKKKEQLLLLNERIASSAASTASVPSAGRTNSLDSSQSSSGTLTRVVGVSHFRFVIRPQGAEACVSHYVS